MYMSYGNLQKLGNNVKVGNKVQVGNKVTIKWNVWSMEMSLYMVMSQNVMQHLGEGWVPHIDHKTSWVFYAFFLLCCGCDTSYIVSVHIQCQASIYTLPLCRGHSWRVRLARRRRWLLPGTWSHLWFAGVTECPPWCSIVGATVTVHQFFCILHSWETISNAPWHIIPTRVHVQLLLISKSCRPQRR